MQIFRPFISHEKSAMYLDDSRLLKQILESYQINNMCLRALGIIEGNRRSWSNHPIVRYVHNDGVPLLPDHWNYMMACSKEWRKRGKNQSPEFLEKMLFQKSIIKKYNYLFDFSKLPPYFRFANIELHDNRAYKMYQILLKHKWINDTICVKCSI